MAVLLLLGIFLLLGYIALTVWSSASEQESVRRALKREEDRRIRAAIAEFEAAQRAESAKKD